MKNVQAIIFQEVGVVELGIPPWKSGGPHYFEKQDILLDQRNSTAKVVTIKSANLEAYLAQSFNSQIQVLLVSVAFL